MPEALTNHLWQSTAFTAITGLLTLAFRANRARVRHWLWFAASVKFLVPMSLFIGLGQRIEFKSARVEPSVTGAVQQIVEPFTVQAGSLVSPTEESRVPDMLFAVWIVGVVAISASWFVRWLRIQAVVRSATPWKSGIKVSDTNLEPGVFGILRPVLLLPRGIFDRLPPAQLRAIIAHEMCHIRHRDNLLAATHMIVETIFWFHPLVWWIGKRMVEERELACDEEVLRTLGEPQAYAEGILNVCKLYIESPLPCLSGVTGADLKKRIEAIMKNRSVLHLKASKKLLLIAAGITAIALPLSVGVVLAQGRQDFEVAMLRLEDPKSKVDYNRPDAPNQDRTFPTNRITRYHTLLKSVIADAYGVPYGNILGGPAWLTSQHYDLSAKVEGEARLTKEQMRPMLQTLLKERLKLAVHTDRRVVAGYHLVIAKGGSKIKANAGAPFSGSFSGDQYKSQNGSLYSLVSVIASVLKKPVVDKTGLSGTYDFDLKFMPEDAARDSRHAAFGTIESALQDQLGLKLEAQRVSVDYLVIDRVERVPTEN